SLVSIFLSGSSFSRMAPGRISLDDITVKGPGIPPDGLVIEGYEEPGRWAALPNSGQVADTADRTREAARSGRAGLAWSWREPWGTAPRGVFIPSGPFPLPAIGGPMFRLGQELRVQSGGQLVPVVVRDVTDYFPTIDPLLGPFLLMGLADYRQYLERAPGGSYPHPKELWATLEGGADRSQVVRAMRERLPDLVSVQDRATQVDLAQRNPLAGGGWNSLTLLGVIALTGAVVLALSIHAAVSVHIGRVDLTVARALGFSQRQLFLSLALERAVLAVLGVAAGSAIGIGLGRWVLGFLDLTASGRPVIPPMTPTLHGWLVALVLVNLLVAALLAILLATLAARRLRAPDILRAG
ncbi:MAG: FtsX-like permease family protein, partial [Chloroflexota bacterium]